MKAKIFVTLKTGVLDPQGQAAEQTLQHMGFAGVSGVRCGKLIELDLAEEDAERAEAQVTEMCEKLLANTVIETYRFELEG